VIVVCCFVEIKVLIYSKYIIDYTRDIAMKQKSRKDGKGAIEKYKTLKSQIKR